MLPDSSWEPLKAEGKGTPRSEVAGVGGGVSCALPQPQPFLSSF